MKQILMFVLILVIAAACSPTPAPVPTGVPPTPGKTVVDGQPPPSPAPVTPNPPTLPPYPGASAPTAATAVPVVTIAGVVKDVLASARVINLAQPVEGLYSIAVAANAQMLSDDGKPITLTDITPGRVIEATGRPTGSGALLADRVILVRPQPTPAPYK